MESKEYPNIDDMKGEVLDALTCFICAAKVKDPVMCPKCKKLVCTICINKWFDEGHNKCPYCQTESNFDIMIPLPFMNHLSEYFIKKIDNNNNKEEEENNINNNMNQKNFNEIIDEDEDDNEDSKYVNKYFGGISEDNHLSKTQFFNNNLNLDANNINNNMHLSQIKKKGEFCPIHKNEIIEFYCLNCYTKHCSKCLLFFSKEAKNHEGHKIISIEKKNKYKLEDLKNEIDDLYNVVNEITGYKDNIEVENKIYEKKEEFIKKIMDEFKIFYNSKSDKKKYELDIKNQLIKNQINKINNIRNNYINAIDNFIERDDENGFRDYYKNIKEFKDTNRYKYSCDFKIFFKPSLKFYETDFLDIDIHEFDETIGEIFFNMEGMDKQLHLRLNGDVNDEVLINLLIKLDNNEGKDEYHGFLIIKNEKNITQITLDEKMVHDGILILGRTIIKSGLNTIVDKQNKCHLKLILAHMIV